MASLYLYNYNQSCLCKHTQALALLNYLVITLRLRKIETKESRRENSILSIIQLLIQLQENEKSVEDNHNNNGINIF
jgi:hypothetical protein